MAIEPTEAIVFEDTRFGVEAALRAGMTCVALPAPDDDAGHKLFQQADCLIKGGPDELDPQSFFWWFDTPRKTLIHAPHPHPQRRRAPSIDSSPRRPADFLQKLQGAPLRRTDMSLKILTRSNASDTIFLNLHAQGWYEQEKGDSGRCPKRRFLLKDRTPLFRASTGQCAAHGEHFFSTFLQTMAPVFFLILFLLILLLYFFLPPARRKLSSPEAPDVQVPRSGPDDLPRSAP